MLTATTFNNKSFLLILASVLSKKPTVGTAIRQVGMKLFEVEIEMEVVIDLSEKFIKVGGLSFERINDHCERGNRHESHCQRVLSLKTTTCPVTSSTSSVQPLMSEDMGVCCWCVFHTTHPRSVQLVLSDMQSNTTLFKHWKATVSC